MGWAEAMAARIKPTRPPQQTYFIGDVISPVAVESNGILSYEGELIVSCYGGQIMLKRSDLYMIKGTGQYHEGMQIALIGDIFGDAPGSSKALILGEVI